MKAATEVRIDGGVAADETDVTLGERLEKEGLNLEASTKTVTGPEQKPSRSIILYNTLLMVAGLVGVNLVAVFISLFAKDFSTFEMIWPANIFFVAMFFALLMAQLRNLWLLIPTGILLGTGFLMSYSSITNWWHHWDYLWPLQVIVAIIPVAATFLLFQEKDHGKSKMPNLGQKLASISAIAAIVITTIGFILVPFS